MNNYILAIDPGNEESAYALLNSELKPIAFAKLPNEECWKDMWGILHSLPCSKVDIEVAIEMVASYGMAVGKTVFDTCVWIGIFKERLKEFNPTFIYRKDEKMNLCHSMKANDSNIRQALIDRFGVVGTKKNQGWFYGVKKDIWAAIAVGVTYHDLKEEGKLKVGEGR